MNLCIVTPSFSGGGAEKVAVNLANQYASEGKNVTLLVFKGVGPNKTLVNDNVAVVDLGVRRSRYVLLRLRRALVDIAPTHVVSVIRDSNIIVALASVGIKNFVLAYREASTMHGVITSVIPRRLLYMALMKITYRMADFIIANSEDTKADLVCCGISKADKIKVIGNPVIPLDFEIKKDVDINHKWLKGEFKVVLNVGRLHPLKNQKLLIDAFSRVLETHTDAKLIILGDGTEKNALQCQISMLNLEHYVEIIPFKENPFPYYRESDVFVLTSNWEGFGNILVEALACGTPIVSTDCPGGPRSILAEGEFGTLVPVGDAEKLANAIIAHLEEPCKWDKDKLVDRGLEYTVEAVADEYLDTIKSARH